MATAEQKKRLLKAKIAVALHDELGRVPKKDEIERVFLMARVMYKAVLGLHYQRQEQNTAGQQDALEKAGCARIFTDTASGAKAERIGLEEAVSHLGKETAWLSGAWTGWDAHSST